MVLLAFGMLFQYAIQHWENLTALVSIVRQIERNIN